MYICRVQIFFLKFATKDIQSKEFCGQSYFYQDSDRFMIWGKKLRIDVKQKLIPKILWDNCMKMGLF